MTTSIDKATLIINSVKDKFNKIDNKKRFDSESSFIIQKLSSDKRLLDAALSSEQNLKEVFINIASFGTTLNPSEKKSYLLSRANKLILDISYMGLIDIAVTEGSILWAQAKIVYANDQFSMNGCDNAPNHNYNPFSKNRGEISGAYCVAKFLNGDYISEPMSIEEINEIKNLSPSRNAPNSPWNKFFTEMCRKVVIKRGAKYWQGSQKLNNAIHYLNTEGGEGIELKEEKKENDELHELKIQLRDILLKNGIDKHTMSIFLSQNNINTKDQSSIKNLISNPESLIMMISKFKGEEPKKDLPDPDTKPVVTKPDVSIVENLTDMFRENGITTKENQQKFLGFINCNVNNEKHVRLWLNQSDIMAKKALEFAAKNLSGMTSLEEIEHDKTELEF